jgi:hypothetical protein
MNVGADFVTAIGLLALQSSPNPLSSTFDLNDLDQHNFPIEHDASLSRQDAYFGNDYSFDQSIFNQVLAYFEGSEETSIPAASKARYNRVETARSQNPEFIYGVRQLVLSAGETALYLSTMGDPTTGVAPVKYVKSLFGKSNRIAHSMFVRRELTDRNREGEASLRFRLGKTHRGDQPSKSGRHDCQVGAGEPECSCRRTFVGRGFLEGRSSTHQPVDWQGRQPDLRS